MRRSYLLLLGSTLLAACVSESDQRPATLPDDAEAISLLGDTLFPPELPDSTRIDREQRLGEARAVFTKDSLDRDAIIWMGRRTAYLGRYRDAIAIYTRGIEIHPNDASLARHRGHRNITLRQLSEAVTDLTRAARLIEGTEDEIEPDGLPNALNQPTSTLQFNIWYHLGLAYYLQGEFEQALDAYYQCLAVSTNDDMLVATSHWLYMTLRRLGRDEEAARGLVAISQEMEIIESFGYHQLLLMYQGVLPPDSLLDLSSGGVSLAEVTTGYGVGNWYLYNGYEVEAYQIFQAIVAGREQWAAFGYLAAEAELARR